MEKTIYIEDFKAPDGDFYGLMVKAKELSDTVMAWVCSEDDSITFSFPEPMMALKFIHTASNWLKQNAELLDKDITIVGEGHKEARATVRLVKGGLPDVGRYNVH